MAGGNGMVDPGTGVEETEVCEREELRAKITTDAKEVAIETCKNWDDSASWPIYSDGSRNEEGHVGAGVAWKQDGGWRKRKVYLGRNKEVIDAELYGIAEAVKITRKRSLRQGFRKATVFVDATAALHRIQNNEVGGGQGLARRIIGEVRHAQEEGLEIEFYWSPGHKDIAGNEEADKAAKEAASKKSPYAPREDRFTSIAHLNRRVTEEKYEQYKEWLEEKCHGKPNYRLTDKRGMDQIAAKRPKGVALRYFQLKTNHAMTGTHLKRIGRRESERCWFCGHTRQTRHHLFFDCPRWRDERETLWTGLKGGKKRWKTSQVNTVLAERGNTEGALTFLEATRVGQRPGQELERRIQEIRSDEWGWESEKESTDGEAGEGPAD
jgi:ribonuclease HI